MKMESDLDRVVKVGGCTTEWKNGKKGIITIKDDYIGFGEMTDGFIGYKRGQDVYKPAVIADGLVVWLVKNLSVGCGCFEQYYNQSLAAYEDLHKCDADLWKRDLKKEFPEVHYKQVVDAVANVPLFDYLCDSDVERIRCLYNNYIEWLQYNYKCVSDGANMLDSVLPKEWSADVKRYFDKAIDAGYIDVVDGGLRWVFGGRTSQARLGYFCNRVFDTPRPISDLERLFQKRKLSASISAADFDYKRSDTVRWRKEMNDKIFND